MSGPSVPCIIPGLTPPILVGTVEEHDNLAQKVMIITSLKIFTLLSYQMHEIVYIRV